jgi:TraM recognition site of TraD and TraG
MIFETFTLFILSGMFYAQQNLFILGLLSGSFLIAFDAGEDHPVKQVFFTVLGVISAIPLMSYFAIPYLAQLTDLNPSPSKLFAALWVGCAIFSWFAAVWWLRYGTRKYDVFTAKITAKTSLERNKKTDVREITKHLPTEALKFDPLKFMDKKRGVLLGLNEQKEPTYIEFGGGTSAPHVQVIGTTGAGKGVSLGVMASQFLERDEAVFFCDPKNDEWAPSVMFDAAKRMGKPYAYINLNRPNGPQFNLFEGATEDEAFELFQAGFSLTEKGDASDFYGIEDRAEAGKTAELIARDNLTISQAYAIRMSQLSGDDGEGEDVAKKFYGKLREMAMTPSINAKSGGVSLADIIAGGGCVYIVGSMRNDIIKTAQRILLVRLIQLCERRDRMAGELRKVCVILDEVKYHLSRPALEGLGAARDKGMHLVLAHQSLGDLKDCTKDLNPDAVVDAVVENCRIKICYKVQSPVTAEWLAQMSGTIQVDDESRQVKKNLAQAETVEGARSIRQADRYFIDENMLLNLPPQVSVLYGAGLPKFVSIQPLKVPKSPEAIRIVICESGMGKTAEDKLNELEIIDAAPADEGLPMLD